MHGNLIDLTGSRFGRLIVISRAGRNTSKKVLWNCRCDCGTTKSIRGANLRRNTKSCGCLHREGFAAMARADSTHGHTRAYGATPTFHSWKSMRERCYRPSHRSFASYGGRGISVCERWSCFETFLADMGERPDGMTLDRIDNDGNYEPGNCQWSDGQTQARNRRSTPFVTARGLTFSAREWADHLGIKTGTLGRRARNGGYEKAVAYYLDREGQA